jgi:folate-dependent tRNA-U54 methylase TrmFO/GidA
MSANFGIMADLDFPHKKNERKALYGKRAIEVMEKEIRGLND